MVCAVSCHFEGLKHCVASVTVTILSVRVPGMSSTVKKYQGGFSPLKNWDPLTQVFIQSFVWLAFLDHPLGVTVLGPGL